MSKATAGTYVSLTTLTAYPEHLPPNVDKEHIYCYCIHMRQEGKKATSSTVSGRVPASLRRRIDAIAEAEKRSVSSIVEMALEYLAQQYEEIHPQFKEDLLAGLAQLDAGEVMPYERG